MSTAKDEFDLLRFVAAQENVIDQVRSELRAGEKRSHWMWYVFPQFEGLGHSGMARRYAIGSRAEANAYLAHPVLGSRLAECTRLVLAIEGKTISQIFGYPDDLKFKSSMTLFEACGGGEGEFGAALERYFGGERDESTVRLLGTG